MIKAPQISSKTTATLAIGAVAGVVVGAAAKTIVALAVPAALAIVAGTLYWKRRKASA